ncbi:COPI associated protein-domain-containing protein [Helicostylum pulchrum]|nr:COPI associated protein-domain-containing protein [Helicostylum pulchrum]
MISRSKVEHIVSLALNGINIILYLLIITAIIFKCIDGKFSEIVLGIYGIIMAALLVINELREIQFSYTYFFFLSTYRGRGLIMVFFGCLVLDFGIVNIVVGTLVLATGLLYIIMSFLSNFPQPHPITINWRNWNDFSAEGLDLPHHRNINNHVVSQVHERLKSPAPILPNQSCTEHSLLGHQTNLDEMIYTRK